MADPKKGSNNKAAQATGAESAETLNQANESQANEQTNEVPALVDPDKDFAGNPIGTIYNEEGKALPLDAGLNNLPQDADKTFKYNEDGTLFKVPVDADKRIAEMNATIAGIKGEINRGKQKIETATDMLKDADDSEKPAFEKAINSQRIAMESRQKALADTEAQLAEFKLSLVTPGQRAVERKLADAYKRKEAIQLEIEALLNEKKLYSFDERVKEATPKKAKENLIESDEQKANHTAAIAKYGSQGKAIVAMVKEGKTNTEIYKFLGIPAASVPGPKNDFLRSAEGQAWEVGSDGRARIKS